MRSTLILHFKCVLLILMILNWFLLKLFLRTTNTQMLSALCPFISASFFLRTVSHIPAQSYDSHFFKKMKLFHGALSHSFIIISMLIHHTCSFSHLLSFSHSLCVCVRVRQCVWLANFGYLHSVQLMDLECVCRGFFWFGFFGGRGEELMFLGHKL